MTQLHDLTVFVAPVDTFICFCGVKGSVIVHDGWAAFKDLFISAVKTGVFY